MSAPPGIGSKSSVLVTGRLPALRRELEPVEGEGWRHNAAHERPRSQRRAACHAPAGTTTWTSSPAVTSGRAGASPPARRPPARCAAPADHPRSTARARRRRPDASGILAGRQEEQDRARDRPPRGARRVGTPRLDVPAALGMGRHPEPLDDRAPVGGHVWNDSAAATANPNVVARPTARPPCS